MPIESHAINSLTMSANVLLIVGSHVLLLYSANLGVRCQSCIELIGLRIGARAAVICMKYDRSVLFSAYYAQLATSPSQPHSALVILVLPHYRHRYGIYTQKSLHSFNKNGRVSISKRKVIDEGEGGPSKNWSPSPTGFYPNSSLVLLVNTAKFHV
ncbi:hypothetical protein BDR07DRAFT_520895 [Suillus spraguei]|nr:hypothetical protein BDR07DRAFT_520895 [Suillus spraguei]